MGAHNPVIQTPHTILRQWTDADLTPFAALNADPRVMEHFPKPLTREESDFLAKRISEKMDIHGFGLWALEIKGVTPFAGFVGLTVPGFESHFTPCVEVGWRLAFQHWGHGYATEAAAAAVEFGFIHAGLDQIVSFTVPANVRSRRVMERLGMTHSPDDDFDHPLVLPGSPHRRLVLYRLSRLDWRGSVL